MEKQAETLFKKYKTQYIQKLGRHALDNVEIDTLAQSKLGTRYKGGYAQDSIFELKSGFYIINQHGPEDRAWYPLDFIDHHSENGLHLWQLCQRSKKTRPALGQAPYEGQA